MIGLEPMCSGDCGQYYFFNGKHCCKATTYTDIDVCIPGLRNQRDEYRDKMNESRREICRAIALSISNKGGEYKPTMVAEKRDWKCFEGEGYELD